MKTTSQIESKRRYLTRSLLLLVTFSATAFEFSPGLLRAEETPVPSAVPAVQGAVGISPTPSAAIPFSVHAVGVWQGREKRHVTPKTRAGRGDTIWLDIINFEDWVNSLQKKPDDHEIRDLVLYLDHFPLLGVSPIYWYNWPAQYTAKGKDGSPPIKYSITTVGFPLVRNESSKEAWAHVLNQPVPDRRVIVSAGFKTGEEIPSEVTPDKVTGEDQQFDLTIIPMFRTAFGFIVIIGALIAFFALARYTDIIRDTAAPRRPDGQRPYSLARGQMAFWFFLVIASYFFLWIVTGDMNSLNSSVLALIGISAGTALGSAFVDAAKPVAVGSSGNQPIVDVTRPHNEVVVELKKLRADTEQELEALQKARTLIAASDKQALDDNEQQQNEVRERLANYRWQSAYFAWPTWKGVMYDLLAENNFISFHRFQIFIWTLILGIMFVANVYNELSMPEFSATLLGLLGISAGTYVGFKLPEAKAP
ncbi:MAG TPA: hypothetical protein VFQ78_11655 [Candidatus Udaeobacter sp.]|jgi:hypothetical protein|nr:hypothetical protein [Candidatus Udaeobacter sp.]